MSIIAFVQYLITGARDSVKKLSLRSAIPSEREESRAIETQDFEEFIEAEDVRNMQHLIKHHQHSKA